MRSTYSKTRKVSPFEVNHSSDDLFTVWYSDLSEEDKLRYAAVPKPDWIKFGGNRWEVHAQNVAGQELTVIDEVVGNAMDSYCRQYLARMREQRARDGRYVSSVRQLTNGTWVVEGRNARGDWVTTTDPDLAAAVEEYVLQVVGSAPDPDPAKAA